MTDFHTHIIYGVDDGARTLEESIAMLRQEERLGIDTICLTPHYIRGLYDVPKETLLEKISELQEYTSIRLLSGNEMLYSKRSLNDLIDGKVLTLGDSEYILTEFEVYTPADEIFLGCEKISKEGFIPVVAHIERLAYLTPELADALRKTGTELQMNYSAVERYVYPGRSHLLKTLFLNNSVRFVGSDAHNNSLRKPNIEAPKLERFCKKKKLELAEL